MSITDPAPMNTHLCSFNPAIVALISAKLGVGAPILFTVVTPPFFVSPVGTIENSVADEGSIYAHVFLLRAGEESCFPSI